MSTMVQIEKKPSAFDDKRAPEQSVMDKCVHCGFCLPACPTYVLWGEEMDSPRGRIWMMRMGKDGNAKLDVNFQTHMDNCLGCMACMTACPSGVEYNKLIEDTRAQVERHVPRSLMDKLFREMLFQTFPYPGRLRLLAAPMWVYQRTGLQKLVRATGLLNLRPKLVVAMESLLPAVPSSFARKTQVANMVRSERPRVGMLTGCVQDVFFGRVNRATVRVLAAEGFDVVTPEQQGCCGALMVHSGLDDDAVVLAKRTIAAFEAADVETIAINAAGCGSTMKEYGHLLRDDPEWASRAKAFSAKCKDISEVLASQPARAKRNSLPMRVAYHDACHLQHAQGVRDEPRSLLGGIPGMEVREIAEASLCCGSAGVYNLLHPEAADELGDRKVANLLETGAEAVVSANPGCLLQLMHGLRRRGKEALPAFHMVELLDASIRGVGREELMRGEGERA